jgi:hypothetical protein
MRRRAWCLALVVAACDEPPPNGPAPLNGVAAVAVSPLAVRLLPGDSVQLTAQVRDSAGAPLAAPVTWTSRRASIATVDSAGMVHALLSAGAPSEDTTWIVATAGSHLDSARVIVADEAPAAGAALMGMNLAQITDWSTEWPFVDMMRMARLWIPQREGAAWGEGGPLALTSDWWISSLETGQYATTIMLNDVTGRQPLGDYVLLYDGEGDLRVEINPAASVVEQSPGRMVVRLTATTGGVFLNLRGTNPANPLRNIRFLRPGTESSYRTDPFGADFLRVVRPFGVLRFMQWQSTNDNPVADWALRSTPAFATFAGPWGVPVEVMVELANTAGADPWFSMPHAATDEYVRQFASLVRTQLSAGRRVYVEYSNEVWNGIYPQAAYTTQRGLALGLSADPFQASLRFYSQRAQEIFAIWRTVFGADSARVVRVLASQASNAWTAEQVLSWQDAFRRTDAIAIAPYFGGFLSGGDGAQQAAMSESQVLDALLADIEGPVRGWIADNARVARTYGVRLVAYEGGQHLVSAYVQPQYEPAVTRLFHAVNRHPRMYDLYQRYFDLWHEEGGELFLPYYDADVWSRYGSWGALEYVHQDPATAPKYQAIVDAAARFGRR